MRSPWSPGVQSIVTEVFGSLRLRQRVSKYSPCGSASASVFQPAGRAATNDPASWGTSPEREPLAGRVVRVIVVGDGRVVAAVRLSGERSTAGSSPPPASSRIAVRPPATIRSAAPAARSTASQRGTPSRDAGGAPVGGGAGGGAGAGPGLQPAACASRIHSGTAGSAGGAPAPPPGGGRSSGDAQPARRASSCQSSSGVRSSIVACGGAAAAQSPNSKR